jgi:hypothetical protein
VIASYDRPPGFDAFALVILLLTAAIVVAIAGTQ